MFGLIGLLFSVVFGLVFGTSKFALRNAIRISAFSLVGYLVYELITGYTQGKSGGPAPAPVATAPAPRPSPAPATSSAPSPIVGGSDHAGQAVRVQDAGGVARTTRVGRGVIRR